MGEYTMESTTESTTDFTTPTPESTPLASVKPKLTLNTYTTLTLDSHTLLDTPDTTDTQPHTPTATCGTDISTKNQYLICNTFLLKKISAKFKLGVKSNYLTST